jgi:SagB-type dehydrogenase family enzyme
MKKQLILKNLCLLCLLLLLPLFVQAEELKSISLLPPDTNGGRPLMETLKERKSGREFSSREIPLQILSDMLWAANGINRPGSGYRTAPSAKNMQEIDIYVVKTGGVYLYNGESNILTPIISTDIREVTGIQPFVKDAPVNLIYVADFSKMGSMSSEDKDFYAATDTGFISQNVYLYCASAGLSTVVRGWIDKPALAKAMKLRPDQKIILAQTAGYPE